MARVVGAPPSNPFHGGPSSSPRLVQHLCNIHVNRLPLAVAALVLTVGALVVVAGNLTDTREDVPPIELRRD